MQFIRRLPDAGLAQPRATPGDVGPAAGYRKGFALFCVCLSITLMTMAFNHAWTPNNFLLAHSPPLAAIHDAQPANVSQPARNLRDPGDSTLDTTLDVVYTWVNGSDPAWQARYMHTLNVSDVGHKRRFSTSGEILLSIASVYHMIPWVRTIWVVTQNQSFDTTMFTPELQQRIRFLDHTAFIPAQYLPTFNSNAIEAFLGFIPGLSKVFLYLNDDIFIACHINQSYIFQGGRVNAFGRIEHLNAPPAHLRDDWWHVVWNTRMLIARKTGLQPYIAWHAGHVMTRDAFTAAWAMFPEELHQTAAHRVRFNHPLEQGGDLTVPLLMVCTALFKGYQQLNTSFSWLAWWQGVVSTTHDLYTAPSWQAGCILSDERKPLLFINIQDMTSAEQAALWCNRSASEYRSAWAHGYGQACICDQMPIGSACHMPSAALNTTT